MMHAQMGFRRSSNQLRVLAYLAPALFVAAGCGDTATQPGLEVRAELLAHSDGAAPAWSAIGPGTVNLLSDGVTTDPAMSYSHSALILPDNLTWELSTTATQGGAVTLPFTYSGFHGFLVHVTVFVNAFVTNGSGTTTVPLISQGPVNCCTPPSGGFNLSGSVTLNVAPGDVYGFRFGGGSVDPPPHRRLGTFSVDLHPEDKDQCQDGGWEAFAFENQGECVRFIETGKDSRYGG